MINLGHVSTETQSKGKPVPSSLDSGKGIPV